ncbi:hypothetical protein V5O48_011607 [Marasmius crinis-equi]|uniref:EthD domain-containing protein n=1 Tax=Marasmius crinis-equi TaxID=585013 RepID=A0ABR3F5L4_9AGAR
MSSNTPRKDRVKILIFVKKRPDISQEHFDNYWLHEHVPRVLAFMKGKPEPLVYEQLHVNQEERELLKKAGVPVLDYDGIVLFEAASFEGFGSVRLSYAYPYPYSPHPTHTHTNKYTIKQLKTEEYLTTIVPDEAVFADRPNSLIVPLHIASILPHTEELKAPLPEKEVRKDRKRMAYVFIRKEGLSDDEFREAWMQDHARVVTESSFGRKMVKYEQLHPAGPVTSCANPDPTSPVPNSTWPWGGVALIDAPSFGDLQPDAESAKAFEEDRDKWHVPGTLTLLPVDLVRIIDRGVQEL